MIKVVCGIIIKEGKIFLCRRNSNKYLGGYWEFPGGKLEINETEIQSLERELLEELKMEVEVLDHYFTNTYSYEKLSIELIAYTCKLINWKEHLTDHDLFEWIKPKDLLKKKLSPADVQIAKRLRSFVP